MSNGSRHENVAVPILEDNDILSVINHCFCTKPGTMEDTTVKGVIFTIRNESEKQIGSLFIEVEFYDENGNVLDETERKIFDLVSGSERSFRIFARECNSDNIKNYGIKINKLSVLPEASVTGNVRLKILKHDMIDAYQDGKELFPCAVEVSLQNVSDKTIATLVFDALFYDFEGNVVESVKHKEFDIKPNYSRAVLVKSSINESGIVKSYNIKADLALTTDIEKVQIRAKDIVTNKNGEAEISGTAKNISDVELDSSLMAVIYDADENVIGSKSVLFKDMKPGSVHSFKVYFKPQEETVIKRIVLFIGDVA